MTKQLRTRVAEDKAFKNALMEEIGNLDASFALKWVVLYYNPEDLYTEDELAEWAESHGFVRA